MDNSGSPSSLSTSKPVDEADLSDAVLRLKNLKTLYSNDLITQEDFETRRSQIVDEITGTSSMYQSRKGSRSQLNHYLTQESNTSSTLTNRRTGNPPIQTPSALNHNSNNVLQDEHRSKTPSKRIKIQVVKHSPPDWSTVRVEKAEKWMYDYEGEKWVTEQCKVKVDEVPFDKGGLRYVFHLQDLHNPNTQWVAKMSQDLRDSIKREIYFNDVRMQAIARHFCHGTVGYNAYNVPKKVDFLDAFVLHLKQREGSPVCHVERFIAGEYIKYNNNVGWVSDSHRNTPQAFAHFTYEASRQKLLVCDIQGVNDVYTDPQVHSSENQKAFGRGNLGQRGFENFLRTHRCNLICGYLNLTNINQLPIQNMGTVPAQTKIAQGCVSTVPFDFDRSGNIPLLSDKGFPQIIEEESLLSNVDDKGSKNSKHSKNNANIGHNHYTEAPPHSDHEKQQCCCVIL